MILSIKQLTRGSVFGVNEHLFNNQPELSLISNGTECIMLKKKFYLDNASCNCIAFAREKVRYIKMIKYFIKRLIS